MNKKAKRAFQCGTVYSWVVFFILGSFVSSFAQRIDGIAALVNQEVITVTDLRIVKSFGLYDSQRRSQSASLIRSVLEELINQKLVQQFTGENVEMSKEQIDRFMADLEVRFGKQELKEKLDEFGINRVVLREYCTDFLVYKKIISERFSRSVVISLRDLEEHYQMVYIPEQKAKQEPVKQMMDILPEIEAAVQEKNTREQADEWMNNLRNKADIQIRLHEYMDFLDHDEQ
ncbi:MAG: hypothetical protein GF421_02480 [Candidatus Aminicenantes bacterium]|nr:hypothetical protein [Candidatus Aminicenantes bacterium]